MEICAYAQSFKHEANIEHEGICCGIFIKSGAHLHYFLALTLSESNKNDFNLVSVTVKLSFIGIQFENS
jgi:hypothetical protein